MADTGASVTVAAPQPGSPRAPPVVLRRLGDAVPAVAWPAQPPPRVEVSSRRWGPWASGERVRRAALGQPARARGEVTNGRAASAASAASDRTYPTVCGRGLGSLGR